MNRSNIESRVHNCGGEIEKFTSDNGHVIYFCIWCGDHAIDTEGFGDFIHVSPEESQQRVNRFFAEEERAMNKSDSDQGEK